MAIDQSMQENQLLKIYCLSIIQGFCFLIIKIFILTSPLLVIFFLGGTGLPWSSVPLGLNMAGSTISIMPYFYLRNRYGTARVSYCFSSIGAFGLVLAIISIILKSTLLLSLGLFFFGVFNGSVQYYRFIGVDIAGENITLKNKAISYIILGGIVSAFVTPVGLQFFIGEHKEYIFNFAYIYLFCLFLMIVPLWLWKTSLKNIDTVKPEKSGLLEKNKSKLVLALIVSIVSYFSMVFLMTPATPLLQHLGFDFSTISFVLQCHFIGMFLPSLFTGRLISIFGQRKVALVGLVFLILGAYILLDSHMAWRSYAIGLFFVGVGWNFSFIASTSMLANFSRKLQMISILFTFLVSSLGAVFSGVCVVMLGWRNMNLIVIVTCVLVALGGLAQRYYLKTGT